MRKGLRMMLCGWCVSLVVTSLGSSEGEVAVPLADSRVLAAVCLPHHFCSGIWKPCFAASRCFVGMLLFTCLLESGNIESDVAQSVTRGGCINSYTKNRQQCRLHHLDIRGHTQPRVSSWIHYRQHFHSPCADRSIFARHRDLSLY